MRKGKLRFFEVSWRANPSFYWPILPTDVADWEALATAKENPQRLLVYRIGGGHRPGHMVHDLVWSLELIETLQRYGATGYATYPVRVLKGHRPLMAYRGIRVYGKGGPFDPSRSKAEYGPAGGLIGHACICMDESQWDGSDIFTIPGLGICIFVVDALAKEFTKLRLKNVKIEAAEQCSMP